MLRDDPDYPFTPWGMEEAAVAALDREGRNREYERDLVEQFHEHGHDVYLADFTHLGLPACRILVPGVSEIYPIEELVERNNNRGLALLDYVQRLDRLSPAESAAFAEAIASLALDPLTPVSDVIGLCAGPESVWSGTRVGEIEILARLHGHSQEPLDPDEIGMHLHWLAQVPPLPADRQQRYRAAHTLWELGHESDCEPASVGKSLAGLFPGSAVDEALDLIDGHWGYRPLTPLAPGFRNEPRHVALVDAFQRAYRAKLDQAGQ